MAQFEKESFIGKDAEYEIPAIRKESRLQRLGKNLKLRSKLNFGMFSANWNNCVSAIQIEKPFIAINKSKGKLFGILEIELSQIQLCIVKLNTLSYLILLFDL